MTALFEIYIGLGSPAPQVNVRDIINLISARHLQFEVIGIMEGFWEEIREDTLLIQVADNELAVYETGEVLRDLIGHDAISIVNVNKKFQ